jgi:hypothetical protein
MSFLKVLSLGCLGRHSQVVERMFIAYKKHVHKLMIKKQLITYLEKKLYRANNFPQQSAALWPTAVLGPLAIY